MDKDGNGTLDREEFRMAGASPGHLINIPAWMFV